MAFTDVKLVYSELAAAGLKKGTLEWMSKGTKAVIVDSATKQIFEIPKMAAVTKEATKSASRSLVKESAKEGLPLGGKIGIGVTVVVGVAAIGYGAYKLVTYLRNKKDEERKNSESVQQIAAESESPSSNVVLYKVPALDNYINNVYNQSCTMSIYDITEAFNFLNDYSRGDLSIEISQEEMLVLRNIMVRYAKKLAEKNPSLKLTEAVPAIEAPSKRKEDLLRDSMLSLRLQQEVFVS